MENNQAEYLDYDLSKIQESIGDYQISYRDYGWGVDSGTVGAPTLTSQKSPQSAVIVIQVDDLPESQPSSLVNLADELDLSEPDSIEQCLSRCITALGGLLLFGCLALLVIWVFIGP